MWRVASGTNENIYFLVGTFLYTTGFRLDLHLYLLSTSTLGLYYQYNRYQYNRYQHNRYEYNRYQYNCYQYNRYQYNHY